MCVSVCECVRVCACVCVRVRACACACRWFPPDGHVFCEQKNLKMEGCLNVAVVCGKLWCMKCVWRSVMLL